MAKKANKLNTFSAPTDKQAVFKHASHKPLYSSWISLGYQFTTVHIVNI